MMPLVCGRVDEKPQTAFWLVTQFWSIFVRTCLPVSCSSYESRDEGENDRSIWLTVKASGGFSLCLKRPIDRCQAGRVLRLSRLF
ncbi:unnamed protein product [Protopolystoma xenopodis]|uniref:Uncharacterized protein n=1 Tax=Protopolystoma xenopodis TaxID=117903 RepID=A0A448WZE6_9PLAT|nr:unnamed protein product [Protopolystoma xenopodis]